jgi:hypothetical protein
MLVFQIFVGPFERMLIFFLLIQELENLQAELRPLEVQKEELREWAEKRTQMLTWIGLGGCSKLKYFYF